MSFVPFGAGAGRVYGTTGVALGSHANGVDAYGDPVFTEEIAAHTPTPEVAQPTVSTELPRALGATMLAAQQLGESTPVDVQA